MNGHPKCLGLPYFHVPCKLYRQNSNVILIIFPLVQFDFPSKNQIVYTQTNVPCLHCENRNNYCRLQLHIELCTRKINVNFRSMQSSRVRSKASWLSGATQRGQLTITLLNKMRNKLYSKNINLFIKCLRNLPLPVCRKCSEERYS